MLFSFFIFEVDVFCGIDMENAKVYDEEARILDFEIHKG